MVNNSTSFEQRGTRRLWKWFLRVYTLVHPRCRLLELAGITALGARPCASARHDPSTPRVVFARLLSCLFHLISSCECSTPSRNVFSASCRAKAAGEKSGLRVLGGMGWVFRIRCSVLWWDYCISFSISIWIETQDKLDFKLRRKWGCNSTFLYQQVSNPNTPRHWFSFKITWWVGIN